MKKIKKYIICIWEMGLKNWTRTLSFLIGAAVTVVIILLTAYSMDVTSTVPFCQSCHEMKVFHKTWLTSAHGPQGKNAKGAYKATCIKCHTPQDNIFHYIAIKSYSGMKDLFFHTIGVYPDWVKHRENREDYTYESSCRKCHADLLAPEIPIKAYHAHRDYLNKTTKKTCITCHPLVGHGDLLYELKKELHKNKQNVKGQGS